MFIAIGPQKLNKAREMIYLDSKKKGYTLINYISSKAVVSADLQIGDNVYIGPRTGLHPFVQLENNVTLGDNVFIGMNSVIKEDIRIGKGSIIGMGSIIKQDVEEFSVYSVAGTKRRGIDARRIKLFNQILQ